MYTVDILRACPGTIASFVARAALGYVWMDFSE